MQNYCSPALDFLEIPSLFQYNSAMNDKKKPETPEQKSSWKSLAGSLFGIHFDDQADFDDLDIDSVAEVVEQMNPVASPSKVKGEEAAAVDDDLETDFDFSFDDEEEDEVLEEQADQPRASSPVENKSKLSEVVKSTDPTPSELEVRNLRATFDDEDPFGLGIVDSDDFSDLDDDSSPELEAVTENTTEAKDDFAEDLDSSDPEPDEKSVKPKRVRRPSRKPRAKSETIEEVEVVAETKKSGSTADQNDDFWEALDDWDWDKKDQPRKQRSTRAIIEDDEDDDDDDENESVNEAASEDETSETEDRPRKRGRRRRRRGGRSSQREDREVSAENDDRETEKTPAQQEIDASLIDELWGSDDDDAEVKSPSLKKEAPEDKPDDSESRRRPRRSRRGRDKESTPVEEVKAKESVSAKSAPKEVEEDDDDDTDNIETKPPSPQYKSVPTWSDAIGMIVKRRNSDRGAPRSDSGRGGDRKPSGNGGRRRSSRSRDE
ncbi:hypothetical protein [Rubinisphaera sp.]|uniref:hypothetical protein n=1 Tax=Rubinisphaera sp. TaxID=2024857 RepID=UPI000EC8F85C|nr:hypothetical protein [Rubinisphaera sp.]HCS55569.1 hypothetical protein [Planctomycetaceae bacterium]